jgi:hypothetical protein
MPVQPFTQLGAAIPSIRDRVTTFTDYSKSSVDQILGPAASGAVRVGATSFDHVVLLNRGDHFETRALPAIAQAAPASGVVVADFDGDGHEDVFLAQNFFPTELETPRFDAGVGLLLRGDGTGGFQPLDVRTSGIEMFGDQRGAASADYDADGRVDLAVGENGGQTTLWHNRAAKAGIRVHVDGGPDNPFGIGAQLRATAGSVRGAAREIHGGGGYWSMDGATTIIAKLNGLDSIWVRWPNGTSTTVPVASSQTELTLRMPR